MLLYFYQKFNKGYDSTRYFRRLKYREILLNSAQKFIHGEINILDYDGFLVPAKIIKRLNCGYLFMEIETTKYTTCKGKHLLSSNSYHLYVRSSKILTIHDKLLTTKKFYIPIRIGILPCCGVNKL